MSPDPPTTSDGRKRPGRGGSRRGRAPRLTRILTGVALALAIMLGLTTLATRTPLCKLWLLPMIGGAMGVKVEARSAIVLSSGTVVLEDAVFILPDLEGPASRFLEVARLEVDPDLSGSGLPITRMRLDGAVFRVSQATDSQRVNLQHWELPGGSVAGSGTRSARRAPPRVDLRSAVIELGEHGPEAGPDGYTVLKRITVRGAVVPASERDGSWAIDLHEADPLHPTRALPEGIAVAGRIDDAGVHLAMTRASLADWPASAVPSRHRGIFEMLAIEGEITRTFLELPWEGEVAAGIVLRDVSMTLPFERRDEAGGEGQEGGVRLTRSGGTIAFIGSGLRATLDGWVEDLPYTVTLDYRGLSASSPFTCELATDRFMLGDSPRLLPFMPREVLERLEDFRNPTGLVDAHVLIERAEPADGVEAPTRFSGQMRVREGRAAFRAFPYPFERMEADVSFDDDAVRLDRITGVSASGARLVATGIVSPLGETAEVNVRVTVTGAPIDGRMFEAMGPDLGPVVEGIFSQGRQRELEDAGLVLSPGGRDALLEHRDALNRRLAALSTVSGTEAREEARRVRAEVARADRALRAPTFAPGGTADVVVEVHRALGIESNWTTRVDVHLARAGVLAEHFPVPVEASGVRFRVVNNDLTLESGAFSPISGGTVDVDLQARIARDGSEPFDPRVRLGVRGVPADRLLLHALAHAGPLARGAADREGDPARGGWLDGLRDAAVQGQVSADVSILRRESGSVGFDADVTASRLRITVGATESQPEMVVHIDRGTARVDEHAAMVRLDASLAVAPPGEPDGAPPISAGLFAVWAELPLRSHDGAPATYRVGVGAQDVLTESPIERIVGLVSPEGARALGDLRARYDPRGRAAGLVEVTGTSGGASPAAARVTTEVHGLSSFDLAMGVGRVGLSDVSGVLRVTAPGEHGEGLLEARPFAGRMTLNGRHEGHILLEGSATLLPGEDEGSLRTGALDMRMSLADARLESALIRAALEAFAPERGSEILPLDPAGEFALDLDVRRGEGAQEPSFEGTFRPHALALTLEGHRLSFDRVDGVVQFDGRGGQAEVASATGPLLSASGEVVWTRSPDGLLLLDARGSASAPSLSEPLRALLPRGLIDGLDQIEFRSDGAVGVSELAVSVVLPTEGEPTVRASGTARVEDASASVGVPLEHARGSVWFEAASRPGASPAYTLNIAADSARAGGLLLSGARARVRSGEQAGEVLVPHFEAGTYGGRLAGSGRIIRGAGNELRYDVAVQASGVRFASLLGDREGGGDPAAPPEAADASRGLLAAEVTLGGVVGRDQTRRGRGSIQIGGGPVVSLPLLMPVIEVSNLQLPANTPLDVAFVEFFVLGDTVTFEELSAFTRSVEIWGYGTMDWPTRRLSMRFSTRSTSPIPVVSELLEGVRNELVSTRVRGTLESPSVDTVQFSGTRMVLDTLLGDGPSEQARRLAQIGERARLNRTRALRAGERLRWLVASQMEAEASTP